MHRFQVNLKNLQKTGWMTGGFRKAQSMLVLVPVIKREGNFDGACCPVERFKS